MKRPFIKLRVSIKFHSKAHFISLLYDAKIEIIQYFEVIYEGAIKATAQVNIIIVIHF